MSQLQLLAGSTIGFGAWVVNIASMGNIISRPNDEGDNEFAFKNVVDYLKLPFNPKKASIAWGLIDGSSPIDRLKLLSMNWVVMAGLGAGAALFLSKC
jgi:hypothetical protein